MILNQGGGGIVPKKTIEETTITPGTEDQVVEAQTYLRGALTIEGDVNLTPENINPDVSIFGVPGGMELNLKDSDTLSVPAAEDIQGYSFTNLHQKDNEIVKGIYASKTGYITDKIFPIEVTANKYVVVEQYSTRASYDSYYNISIHWGVEKKDDSTFTTGTIIQLSDFDKGSHSLGVIYKNNILYVIYGKSDKMYCDIYDIDQDAKATFNKSVVIDSTNSRYFDFVCQLESDNQYFLPWSNNGMVLYIDQYAVAVLMEFKTKILPESQMLYQISGNEFLSFYIGSGYLYNINDGGKIQLLSWLNGTFTVEDITFIRYLPGLEFNASVRYIYARNAIAVNNGDYVDILMECYFYTSATQNNGRAIARMRYNKTSKKIENTENDYVITGEEYGYINASKTYYSALEINNVGEYSALYGYSGTELNIYPGYPMKVTGKRVCEELHRNNMYKFGGAIYYPGNANDGIQKVIFKPTVYAYKYTDFKGRTGVSKYSAAAGEETSIIIPKR